MVAKKRVAYKSRWSQVFDGANAALMVFLCLAVLLPFWFLLVQSLDNVSRLSGGLYLWPQEFTLKYYRKVLSSKYIWLGYMNTLYRVGFGTLLSLFCTSMGAYAISKKYFPHRTFWTFFMLFTMFFGGGLIPTFLWYRTLGFIDNRLVYILPGMVGVYNLVMIRNFISTIPGEMEESARLDGANDFQIYLHIILPMSKPILATVGLWLIVGNWNAWFDCLVYMRSGSKQVLQVVLRRILNEGSNEMLEGANVEDMAVSPEMLKAATIFVSTIPVLLIYPFLQKYFVKGVMVGAIKA